MSAKLVLFYAAVVLGGLGLLVADLGQVTAASPGLLALWFLLILAVDAAPVRLPGGGFITVSSVVDVAGILILGPVPVALAELAATLVLQLGLQRRPLHRAVFNASLFAGTVMLAGHVFRLLGGVPGAAPDFPAVLPAVVGLGLTYYAVNTWAVSLVLALSENRRAWHVWQTNYLWTLSHMVVSLPFALAAAVGWNLLGLWGLLIFMLPVALVRVSYRLYVDTKEDLVDFATVLAGVIDEVDPYTRKHSQRVSRYAGRIARELGLPESEVERIEYAGLLHDIGKIKTVSREVLLKPGKLTPEEREIMNLHPVMGADMLGAVRAFRKVAPIVRHHHERPDGKGYPAGLHDHEIPVGSKVVLVADAFDAMTTDRVYRKALPLDRAVGELKRHAGTQFDARVVEALERLVARGEFDAGAHRPDEEFDVLARPGLVNPGLAEG